MANDNGEAARWFAASRRGVMLQEERAAYEDWRRDPKNAASLSELTAIWCELDSTDGIGIPDYQAPGGHRGQLAAMIAFISITAIVVTHIDTVWWNSLDWWSR